MNQSAPPTSGQFPKPPPQNGERHTLPPQHELRLEIPQHATCAITLLRGSAEIFGAELATFTSDPIKQTYLITGHAKLAVFTWHGCVIDVDVEFGKDLEISYTSEEIVANVAFVNTHAQLEAMRDDALMGATSGNADDKASGNGEGPRVLVVGPADCGKTSLVKVLTSYGEYLPVSIILNLVLKGMAQRDDSGISFYI
jgi:polyribonucleotide 5'-hydroxyl-kinase